MSLFYLFLLLFFKEYKESVDKLQSMLVTLEGKMKDILKENEEKQKVFNIEQEIITFTLHPLPPSPFSLLSLFLSFPFLLSLLTLPSPLFPVAPIISITCREEEPLCLFLHRSRETHCRNGQPHPPSGYTSNSCRTHRHSN